MIEIAALDEVLEKFLPSIRSHRGKTASHKSRNHVFILGLSGLQGSGKSTWASSICDRLKEKHGLSAHTVSLDDFYHTRKTLVRIKTEKADNALLRTRGQPGTHDESLALEFFLSFESAQKPTQIPQFDKSLFGGEGDRITKDEWPEITPEPPIDVIVFEGWCLGFQPLVDEELESLWLSAKAASKNSIISGKEQSKDLDLSITTLADHPLEHLLLINNNLGRYCATFMGPSQFDGMTHLSTRDIINVYRWRLGQEHALIQTKGSGMSDREVIRFVQGYMPAYELYLQRFTTERYFHSAGKNHVRVMLDTERTVVEIDVVQNQN